MTGDLVQLQNQMTAEFAKIIVLQNMALQYEYLQKPTTAPSSFDLTQLGIYIARQQQALLAAKAALNPRPTLITDPVNYTLSNIPSSVLFSGGIFRFQIPVAAKEFSSFTMVRIAGINLVVDGIKATDGSQFVVQLLYRGEPFYDRDPQHNVLEFSTNERISNFLGNVSAGNPSSASEGTDASGGDYSMVTPFSDWEMSFPVNDINKGLSFEGAAVSLTMSFSLVAQINPVVLSQQLMTVADSPGGSTTDMLSQMQGKSCLMGWDAVFSYTEAKINAFLMAQYLKLKQEDAGHLVIPLRTDKTPPDPGTGNSTYTTWAMTLSAPEVAFASGNNQYATVYMNIISAQYEYGIILKDGTKIAVSSFPPPPLAANANIKGQVSLATAQGTVISQQSVVVNLPAGSWEIGETSVSTGNPSFNTFLTDQLRNCSSMYQLGTLDLAANSTLPALTPTSFKFNVAETNSGVNLLQLFIVTDGSAPNQLSLNNVPEPVPAGYDCSLLISSRVMFQRILPQSFLSGKSFLVMTSVSPAAGSAWSSTGAGSLAIPVSLGGGGGEGGIRIDGDSIQLDMTGLTITNGIAPDFSLALNFSRTFNQGFDEYVCSEGHYDGMCLGGEWDGNSVDVTTSLATTMEISVTGIGQQQYLQINQSNVNIDANGDIGSGPCSGGDFQKALVQAYRAAAIPAIQTAVSVPFPSISIFALKNLLFPATNIVNMSVVYAPGDLVILGSFVTSS